MAKQHGSLARAGKVKAQTPKVATADGDASVPVAGRAKKRMQYNRRFLGCTDDRPRRCNPQALSQYA